MKIKITSANCIYGANGEDMFGKTLVVGGDIPAGWAGRYQVVGKDGEGDLLADNATPTDDPNKNEKVPRPATPDEPQPDPQPDPQPEPPAPASKASEKK